MWLLYLLALASSIGVIRFECIASQSVRNGTVIDTAAAAAAMDEYPSSVPTGWTAPSAPEEEEEMITQENTDTAPMQPVDLEKINMPAEPKQFDRGDSEVAAEVTSTINGVTSIFYTIIGAFLVFALFVVYKK